MQDIFYCYLVNISVGLNGWLSFSIFTFTFRNPIKPTEIDKSKEKCTPIKWIFFTPIHRRIEHNKGLKIRLRSFIFHWIAEFNYAIYGKHTYIAISFESVDGSFCFHFIFADPSRNLISHLRLLLLLHINLFTFITGILLLLLLLFFSLVLLFSVFASSRFAYIDSFSIRY